MSKIICIPCLNMEFYDQKYIIKAHSRAKCSWCGREASELRQSLRVSITTSQLKWTTEWPQEEGIYWLYGYRYGKYWGDKINEPELVLMKVFKVSNGLMYNGEGQFIYESEVEEPHFLKADLPELPELE